jgi:dTDP-4-amino-4,6-dideoxygalactose transaminase
VAEDLDITAAAVREALTPRTKCVVVAHLFGEAAPIAEIEAELRNAGVALIEYAARSLGAKRGGRPVGAFGQFGVIACGPGKTLAGPARGVLVSNDPELHRRAVEVVRGYGTDRGVACRLFEFWCWRRFRRWTLPVRLVLDRLLGEATEPRHRPARMAKVDGTSSQAQLARLERNAEVRRRIRARLARVFEELGATVVPNDESDDMAVKLIAVLPESGPDVAEAIERMGRRG